MRVFEADCYWLLVTGYWLLKVVKGIPLRQLVQFACWLDWVVLPLSMFVGYHSATPGKAGPAYNVQQSSGVAYMCLNRWLCTLLMMPGHGASAAMLAYAVQLPLMCLLLLTSMHY
eukprot:GHRR01036349.1.p1 GENE.GHRR01036349.1~~GHRR01036349.1.p1  ORF type:complete len:115 (-),score=14.03 GHRR01036349.1:374-718(-)